MKIEKNNPFDLIEEPEIPIDISQANYQWYVINYPKFYCEDVCKSMYHRRCSNQCEKCLNAIIDHHSQNS